MDHPLPPPDSLIRPWRTAAVVASTIAAVELLVLMVIGGGALLGTISAHVEKAAVKRAQASAAAARKSPPARKAMKAAAEVPRTKVRVMVLNGNGRQGAAAAAASRVQRRGYRIASVGNAPHTGFGRSIVMYRPGYMDEGRRLGRDLGVRTVTPLDGMRVGQLGRAHVVLILGA